MNYKINDWVWREMYSHLIFKILEINDDGSYQLSVKCLDDDYESILASTYSGLDFKLLINCPEYLKNV